MPNADYARAQYCDECTEVNRRRSNRWADLYAAAPRFGPRAVNDNNQTRTCSMCEWELPHSEFQNSSSCRDCVRILSRGVDRSAEYEARKAKRREAVMSPDRIRVRRIGWIEKANRKRRAEKRAMARKIDTYLRQWNNWQIKPWTRPGLSEGEKYRLRYANDNEFVLRERTRQRIRRKGFGFNIMWRMRQALYGEVGTKGLCTIEGALGYSMKDLASHIERLFVDGMSWDEFRAGNIHIDHKKPLSRYDLDDPEQLLEAWSLDNLQPLWAADNMAKGAKTDDEWRAAA